jgi:hypothetical protein
MIDTPRRIGIVTINALLCNERTAARSRVIMAEVSNHA